jgi:hypothetical protein
LGSSPCSSHRVSSARPGGSSPYAQRLMSDPWPTAAYRLPLWRCDPPPSCSSSYETGPPRAYGAESLSGQSAPPGRCASDWGVRFNRSRHRALSGVAYVQEHESELHGWTPRGIDVDWRAGRGRREAAEHRVSRRRRRRASPAQTRRTTWTCTPGTRNKWMRSRRRRRSSGTRWSAHLPLC